MSASCIHTFLMYVQSTFFRCWKKLSSISLKVIQSNYQFLSAKHRKKHTIARFINGKWNKKQQKISGCGKYYMHRTRKNFLLAFFASMVTTYYDFCSHYPQKQLNYKLTFFPFALCICLHCLVNFQIQNRYLVCT